MLQIMVRQWSFRPYFDGDVPDEEGRYSTLIPLESLTGSIRSAYEKSQADFIAGQRKADETTGPQKG